MRCLALLFALVARPAWADPTPAEVQKVLQRDLHPRGQADMDRLNQDTVQRVCTESRDQPPAGLAQSLQADQMKGISFPEGGLIGDWKRGEAIAQSGRGMTWNDKPGEPAGGSCYNCHELSPGELSHGTIGPSLRGFGKKRGTSADAQRYAYGKIYNAKAYNLCTQMPRFGASGTLTPQQIKDLVGLLLDPASPVNQ
ncbi:MAG TPA: sulfur oxidation c-type cytochrome SoxX [Burkholderiales bacterium]|nr:sulfur oxidation c-type cytochrome SoxX [Burkholderiales bacterium]